MVHIFSASVRRTRRIGRRAAGLTLGAMLVLAGCASMPPPDAAMNQAQAQLQAARDAGAADYAPVDLGFAQTKFQMAQTAMASRHFEDAANLAEEARADAELARAKARLGSARAKIQSKVDDNTRLRQQIEQPADAASAPEPARSTPAVIGSAVIEDMPAPSASVLSAPLPQQGFEPAPSSSSPTSPAAQPPQPRAQSSETPTDGVQP